MTEQEWLTCDNNLGLMLQQVEGNVGDRKRRLAGCGYVRLASHLLSDQDDQAAVEVAERYADGQASPAGLRGARKDWVEVHWVRWPRTEVVARAVRHAARAVTLEDANRASSACMYSCLAAGHHAARLAPSDPAREAAWAEAWRWNDEMEGFGRAVYMFWDAAYKEAHDSHFRGCCHIFRDVVGNPFRPVTLDPAWLAWNGGTIPTLARAVYEERELPSGHLDPVRLALIADMLEDARCSDAAILEHLRGPGPHVRGCWAIDLLLGKS